MTIKTLESGKTPNGKTKAAGQGIASSDSVASDDLNTQKAKVFNHLFELHPNQLTKIEQEYHMQLGEPGSPGAGQFSPNCISPNEAFIYRYTTCGNPINGASGLSNVALHMRAKHSLGKGDSYSLIIVMKQAPNRQMRIDSFPKKRGQYI